MDKSKAYQQQMERALRAFENTSEWADLVNALGKVNKVLSNHQQISKIPCDAILGRRLAQCLHPNLPNGLQLKALETYDLLFKAIGSDNLMQELSKYSNGLFPLLSHADLNVKPALLELYETHFSPLKERLRPALDGFLIATLHGLEENTDFFQRTDKLLANVCVGVGAEYFYGSLWRCILIDPSVRLHGMNFLITHFNKKRPLDQQLYILGNSQEALIEAICVSLLDVRNVLVQRAALDLLLCCFPLHNQQISRQDMMKIATGAVTVLLRRDTSLNRRLLSWVFNLNSSKKTSAQTSPVAVSESRKSRELKEKERRLQYFNEYSKSLLLDAFKNCLSDPSKIIDIPNCWSSLGDYWCYRLLICLIDHAELCELILDDLCLEIFRSLCIDFRRPENQRPDIRTLRLLMNCMNISYLWGRVYTLLREVCDERKNNNNNSHFQLANSEEQDQQSSLITNNNNNGYDDYPLKKVGDGPTNVLELCAFYDFMLECFPIENYVEVAKEFLPRILINLLNLMIDHCDTLDVCEYLALNRVIYNNFEGINSIHKDSSLIDRAEAIRNRLNRIPTPLGSNAISSVAEDDECIPEENIELNDSLNNGVDEPQDKSTSELNYSSSIQQAPEPETPSLEDLIQKFQKQFHIFVISRLIKYPIENIESLYKESTRLLQRRLREVPNLSEIQYLTIDENMAAVYESLCRIATLMSAIPNAEENGSELGIEDMISCPFKSEVLEQHQISSSLTTEGDSFSPCRAYISDLLLLSFKVRNIRVNYGSMKLLLDMLTKSQLALDPEFAIYNQPVESTPPSFSEEITASVVGETPSAPAKKLASDRLILLNDEFFYIAKETCWFSLAMKILWENLSVEPMMWPDTVDLIQNIHNLTHQNQVCEDIICATLNDSDEQVAYAARKRFILLFSLMKSDRSDLKLRFREFERPLFYMLDSLANKMDAFNCIANEWLAQVYKNKATSRVLEPILKILLHPDTARNPIMFTKIILSSMHHKHMYLYNQVYDSERILYALNTLWNVLSTDPEQGLMRTASSSIKGCHQLHQLYVRHNNVLAGNNFHDEITIDARDRVPSFLELTIVICLNFLSGHYMPGAKPIILEEIHRNHKVRMLSCEILRIIFSNLLEASKGCPTHPIHEMLNRCHVQEIVLQHIATLVQSAQKASYSSASTPSQSSTPTSTSSTLAASSLGSLQIHHQKELLQQQQQLQEQQNGQVQENLENSHSINTSDQVISFNEADNENCDDFQRTLLRLLEELMILEFKVAPPNVISETDNHSRSARTRDIPDLSSTSLKYFPNIPISSQRLFLSAFKAALQNMQHSGLHVNWLSLIEATINISGRSLTRWISCLISRLCDNLELISNCILNKCEPISIKFSLTPGYLCVLLNSLSSTCLGQNEPMVVARKEVFNKLSQIILALIQVWKSIGLEKSSWHILGAPSEVRKQILALLSPISLQHGSQFMNAISFVWHELRSKGPSRKVIPACSPDQKLLVELVASISDLPMELVLETTRQVISKNEDSGSQTRVPIEVGLLQFFLAYIRLFPGSQLIECWKPLLQLLRDGLQLGRPAMPQAQFTLLALLHEFVQTAPLIEDRKDQKDLQDVAQKLIDSVVTVASGRLYQTRWLRRALEVEPGPQVEMDESTAQAESGSISDGNESMAGNESGPTSTISTGTRSTTTSNAEECSYLARYNVSALNALAEYVAPVLDVVYASDEKDKTTDLFYRIRDCIIPYLKNHLPHNAPSFLACSELLSSISGYPYTRKAWRREALDLLLDAQFFHMDSHCIEHWRIIVDHLMTHDKTTFGEFLGRMSFNQPSGALKIFTSRDQENELRAQLIKRMAFVLFCSERDQYQKYTPDIQEKLIESLRDNPSDAVQSQIILCFRVLIVRSSAHLLTSLWPFVYTEIVQGLLDIEAYIEQSAGNLQVSSATAARFQLFLYTCKLVDTILALPADSLPQFQMYRWSFIGAGDDFEPHLVRIERRLSELSECSTLLPYRNHYPVLTLRKIDNLLDLHPFFKTLVKVNRGEYPVSEPTAAYESPSKFIDMILESDFLG